MRAALSPLCLVSPESIVMSKSVWQGGKFTALLQLRLALFHEKNKKKFFFKPRIWLLLLFVSSQAQFSLTSKCCERFAHHFAAHLFFFKMSTISVILSGTMTFSLAESLKWIFVALAQDVTKWKHAEGNQKQYNEDGKWLKGNGNVSL